MKIFCKSLVLTFKESGNQKGLSQEELANRCEFPMSQIGRIERGIINTSISHVAAIAKALEVPAAELFKFE